MGPGGGLNRCSCCRAGGRWLLPASRLRLASVHIIIINKTGGGARLGGE